jgi:hypothetical protein
MQQRFRRIGELRRFTVRATDGDVGKPNEVFFDDQTWAAVTWWLTRETG